MDLVALEVAQELGFPTGGAMPKGWLSHSGQHPEYEARFGMHENSSSQYAPRTYENVKKSDGTIRIAYTFDSPGERCTLAAIRSMEKPHCDLRFNESGRLCFAAGYDAQGRTDFYQEPDVSNMFARMLAVDTTVKWILGHGLEVINFAGNSLKTAPNIKGPAAGVLKFLLTGLRREILTEEPE